MRTRLFLYLCFPILLYGQDIELNELGLLFESPVCGIISHNDSLIICITSYEYANDNTTITHPFTLIKSPLSDDGGVIVNAPSNLPLSQISITETEDNIYITGIKEGLINGDSIWIGQYNYGLELTSQKTIGSQDTSNLFNLLILNAKIKDDSLGFETFPRFSTPSDLFMQLYDYGLTDMGE